MRARRDTTTHGGPIRRARASHATAVAIGVAVAAFMTVFVLGVWALAPGSDRSDASTTGQPTATNPATTSASTSTVVVSPATDSPSSSSFLGDDASAPESASAPPFEARRAALAFASAWQIPGTPAQRRAALTPVASAYLVRSLVRVTQAPPAGRPNDCRLLGGSAVAAQYRVSFASGEAIAVSVDLSGRRWLAVRVDPLASVS